VGESFVVELADGRLHPVLPGEPLLVQGYSSAIEKFHGHDASFRGDDWFLWKSRPGFGTPFPL
jgi:hypothetical protein